MKSRLAFSNGTEWEIWSHNWCANCVHDEPARRGNFENGCEIVAVALMGGDEEIPEWSEDPDADGWPRVICSECVLGAALEGEEK